MEIVFENENERRAWALFLLAHRRWYKNHGAELVEIVEFVVKVMKEDWEVCELAKELVIFPENIFTRVKDMEKGGIRIG